MKEYYLELVGLRAVLRTLHPITISDNLRPFLCEPHERADCTVTLMPCDQLPPISRDAQWHGQEYYDHQGGTMRIFHCKSPQKKTFAVTEILESGNIHILVLPEHLNYFAGSTGIFNRIGLETMLLQHKGLLLHASLIKYKGKTVAFAGPSGAGKSTQAALWNSCLGATVLNGDRAALRKTESGWIAHGSPYAGTSGIYINDSAPLAAIVLPVQAPENRLERLNGTEAFRTIYPEVSMHRWDKNFVSNATDLCLTLVEQIPFYRLFCRPEESAVQLLQKGLLL